MRDGLAPGIARMHSISALADETMIALVLSWTPGS